MLRAALFDFDETMINLEPQHTPALADGRARTHARPAPEAYRVTASVLGVAPRECLVFEDARVGGLAAKAAGMFCVAIRAPPARMPQDVSAADVVISTFCELALCG